MLPADDELLAAISKTAVPFRGLLKSLSITPAERAAFRAQLRALVTAGRVERLKGNRYRRTGQLERVTGVLTMTTRGFGFVNAPTAPDGIWVDRRNLGTAMHRDLVTVRVQPSGKGRVEGVVEAVHERGTHTFVGTFRESPADRLVHPQDARLPEHIAVERRGGARDGDTVAAQFTRYPDHPHGAAARIIRVFGEEGEAAQETELIVYDLGLRLRFPADVSAAADGAPDGIAMSELERRTDLRARPLVTVDPESARDFDDAVHAEPLAEGGWRMTVAVADVSHFVTPGSPLDREARARGTSVYLPDRVIPMLPERLSADLCSLRPDEDRYAMVIAFDVTPRGELLNPQFMEAVIRSHARFTYDRVADMLGMRGGAPMTDDSAHHEGLRGVLTALRDATRARRAFRKRRGYLLMEVAEPRVFLNAEGGIEDVRSSERHEAHMMIEEAMLAANEIAAQRFVDAELPSLFRVHDTPPDDNLARLRLQGDALGVSTKGLGKPTPQRLSKWIKDHAEHPQHTLLSLMLLRTMAKATYDAEVAPHFGLGAPAYLHFTSPIRRYPDLIVHRLVKAIIAGRPNGDDAALDALAEQSSRRERVAVDAERTVLDLYKALFLRERLGEEFAGTIIGSAQPGVFVQLDDHAVEGMVSVEAMPGDYFELTERGDFIGRRTHERYGLGDRLRVKIESVDVRRRRVELSIVERLALRDA